MTREEAVEVLKERYLTCVGIGLDNHANRVNEALDMAIEAMSAEVVRCKDCRHAEHCHETVAHTRLHDGFKEHWSEQIKWCSMGERKGGEDE